jgi:teichuronic acid biosynthesis glycosyltransferase TuaC
VLRILTFSSLYPNRAQPHHGIFVEQRLRRLVASREVEARVVAPVPWFPVRHRWFGEYAKFAGAPSFEERHGISISHPRYLVIPKVGMTVAPALMAAAAWPTVRRIRERGFDFDLIDAHYFYPDGVAAAMIAARCGVPFVITARGTDINLIPRYLLPRQMIRWAAGRSSAMITVCQALKDELVQLGVDGERVTVLRNGVDLEVFKPMDREDVRQRLGFTRRTLLSVGHLIPRKGHHLVISALRDLPDVDLVIVGDGPKNSELRLQAQVAQVADRVRFEGARTQAELVEYYNAADALVLASDREGMANVLLECLACGTPLIATSAWGTPEVLNAPAAGVLMSDRSPAGVVEAVRKLFAARPDRAETRRHAERFGWDHTTRGQLGIFSRLVRGGTGPASRAARAK